MLDSDERDTCVHNRTNATTGGARQPSGGHAPSISFDAHALTAKEFPRDSACYDFGFYGMVLYLACKLNCRLVHNSYI